jgi:anti-sigma factor RsiW
MTKPKPGEPGFVPPGGINCESCTEMFIDYVEGMLPPGQLRSFEAHHHACVACRTYLANYRRVTHLTSGAAAGDRGEPAAISPNTLAAILHACKHDQG